MGVPPENHEKNLKNLKPEVRRRILGYISDAQNPVPTDSKKLRGETARNPNQFELPLDETE